MSNSDISYFAIYQANDTNGYFGATATIDVQGFPNMKNTEVSSAKIWLQNSENDDAHTIKSLQAGWQIQPEIYGDSNTHFFVFWTNKDDGDWWLHFGSDINYLRPADYWPKSLFTNMEDHAAEIHGVGNSCQQWGI